MSVTIAVGLIVTGLIFYGIGFMRGSIFQGSYLTKVVRYRVAAQEVAKWIGEDRCVRLAAEWIEEQGEDRRSESVSVLRERIRQLRNLQPTEPRSDA